MKINEVLKIVIIIGFFSISLSVFYYFFVFLPRSNYVDNTLTCTQLYEIKKIKYWGENIGQSNAIYNSDLNTCLAYNIYSDSDTGDFSASIRDMSNDSMLMYYTQTYNKIYEENGQEITCNGDYENFEFIQNGEVKEEYGCNRLDYLLNMMLDHIESYGFKFLGTHNPYIVNGI
ncbi:MAG: hypothetical protein WCW30_05365 [Candidatus Gracilibacteria bacterium]|jgi:hypothetical protein